MRSRSSAKNVHCNLNSSRDILHSYPQRMPRMDSKTTEAPKGFYLEKWYMDLIDARTGDLTIIYLGEMKWKFVHLHFTNILRFLQRIQLISTVSFSDYTPPTVGKTSFRVQSQQVSGQWKSTIPSIVEYLYQNDHGYILWECVMPYANGRIQDGDRTHQGLGYIERLTLTLKPWQLPIHILRWGRFLSTDHSIVWIRWQGDEERCLIFHNGTKYLDGTIDDGDVQFSKYRLRLLNKYTLRNGPVSQTVFNPYRWIQRIFPSNFLHHLIERKWQTWSEFYQEDQCLVQGWSVHETVNWKSQGALIGKISYGALFTLILPLLMIVWCKKTEDYITLPVFGHPFLAVLMIFIGLLLMSFAMTELWIQGHGLPMNAYPPPKFVSTGVYRLFSHPIYLGASALSLGLSMYYQSKSGFWLISPLLTLAWLALVYGYENEHLHRRFPHLKYHPLFHLPYDHPDLCEASDVFSAYALVLFPWLLLYQSIIFIGTPRCALSTYLPFEQFVPVIEWTEIFYLLAYPHVVLLPCLIQTKQQLRSYMIDSYFNLGIGIYLQYVLPLIAAPKPFTPTTILGRLLIEERRLDGPTGACPSFHVSWSFISAYHYTCRFPRYKFLFYLLATLISISCATTGMHSLIDILAGWLLFFVCTRRNYLWIHVKNFYQYLANSWVAYRLGPLRIMNYSVYGFLSASSGCFLLCSLLEHVSIVLLVSSSSLCMAALWGQWIEKSSGLSRPFGYFGCILGGAMGSMFASYFFQTSIVAIFAAFALVSPWIQGTGRFRCIVQGCCHGRPTSNESMGVRVSNPKSRVCSLSKLTNIPIHPTAGYSIVANLIIAMLLWRLWYSNVAQCLIIGLYFILIGLSRFVEEAFRGEIQTPIYFQLTIYQWMSMIFVLLGVLVSMLPSTEIDHLHFQVRPEYLLPSLLFGFCTAFTVGIDFPDSNRLFSRLAD